MGATGTLLKGKGDPAARFRAKTFNGLAHDFASELCVKCDGAIIFGQSPNQEGAIAMLGEILARRLEKARAEAQPLKFRRNIEFENFSPIMERGHAVSPIARIAAYGVIEIKDKKARASDDCRVPPKRSAPGNHSFELAPGDEATIGVAPSGIVHIGNTFGIAFPRGPNGDDCFDHFAMLSPVGPPPQELFGASCQLFGAIALGARFARVKLA